MCAPPIDDTEMKTLSKCISFHVWNLKRILSVYFMVHCRDTKLSACFTISATNYKMMPIIRILSHGRKTISSLRGAHVIAADDLAQWNQQLWYWPSHLRWFRRCYHNVKFHIGWNGCTYLRNVQKGYVSSTHSQCNGVHYQYVKVYCLSARLRCELTQNMRGITHTVPASICWYIYPPVKTWYAISSLWDGQSQDGLISNSKTYR